MKQASAKYSIWFTIVVTVSVIGTLMAGLLTSFLSGPIGNPQTFTPALGGFLNASAGLVSFALIYVASDIISEVYGYKASRLVAFINIGASVLLTAIMGAAYLFTLFIIDYDTPTLTHMCQEFFGVNGNVPAGGPILLIWGWVISISGDWINDIVFKIFKKKDGEQKFFKRSILSSVAGQFVDSLLFVPVLVLVVKALHGDFGDGAFVPSIFWKNVIVMTYCQVLFKVGTELVVYPITKKLKMKAKVIEGAEAYQEGTGFNILG